MSRRVEAADGQRLLVRVVGQVSHAMATRDPWVRRVAHKPKASAAQGLAVAEGACVARDLAIVLLVDDATARAYPRLRGARCDATSCSFTSTHAGLRVAAG